MKFVRFSKTISRGLILLAATVWPLAAQTFTKITTGPLVTDTAQRLTAAWADFDQDGYLDAFIPAVGANNYLYRNLGNGTFESLSSAPVTNDGGNSTTGSWGDYDNDGELDLFVVNRYQNHFLYRGLGGGSFAAASGSAVLEGGAEAYFVSWVDYDDDGELDLFVGNVFTPSFLYRNNGDGTFTKNTTAAIANVSANTIATAWGDYNGDGRMDVWFANTLYRNDGAGVFTADPAGPNAPGSGLIAASWADYDNDGDLDLLLANRNGPNFLFRNDGGSGFTQIDTGTIVTEEADSNGAVWGDYDNDGWLDLYVANGDIPANQVNFLYRNNGNGTFSKITTGELVTDSEHSTSAAWIDYDNDGDLDLHVANATGGNALYRNDGNANNWLKVRLNGTESNRAAIGANVRVTAQINGTTRTLLRQVSGDAGFTSQNLELHFGLGNAAIIDEVRVEWPAGTVQTMADVAINQRLTVTESSSAQFSLVIPAGHENSEGGYYAGTLHEPSLRLQVVYGATHFPAGPQTITELRFRRDISEPPFSSATAAATVKLSTTTGTPGGLSATFANNPGPDETTVFSGNWTYSSTSPTPNGTVRPFDIVLPLTTPFTYDPAAGNLLFDIRITSNSSFNWTDGVSGGQHQVSRVVSLNANALTGDANELTGDVIQLVLADEESRILNIDFTANGAPVKSGVAAVGNGPGDVWNRYLRDPVQGQYQDPGSLTNLVWANGSGSGAGLTISNAAGAWDNGSEDDMFWSYLYPLSREGNITVTLTNLPAGEYTFYVYGHGEPDSENGVFTLNNGSATFGPSQTSSAPGWNTTVWTEGVQYVAFHDVAVGGSQPVVLTALPGVSGLAVINGLQLVQGDDDVIWFAPAGGVFTNSVQVAIQSSAGAGTIRYTTNGDEPSGTSPVYGGQFTLTETTTVKARLFVNGFPASEIVEATYTRYVPPDVQFLPPGQWFTNQLSVTLVNHVGTGTIRYTLDGSAPTSSSTAYSGPITLTAAATLRAQVYLGTFFISDVLSESYARVYAFADDGVPFAWREEHFGPDFQTNPCAAAGADCDNDGYSVAEEYVADTDPTDGDSAPEIILTVRAVPRLTFTTIAGRSYRIQRTESLNPPDWQTIVESVLATGPELHYVDEEAPDASYYQIELIQD